MKTPTKQKYRDAARKLYGRDGQVEIDDSARVSCGDENEGAYVQAWVWVRRDEAEGGVA